MENIIENVTKKHTVHIVYNESLEVGGVVSVPAYDDKGVQLKLQDNMLNVTGENLEVKSIDLEQGKVVVCGRVGELKYAHAKEKVGLLKRLFK